MGHPEYLQGIRSCGRNMAGIPVLDKLLNNHLSRNRAIKQNTPVSCLTGVRLPYSSAQSREATS